MFARIGQTTRLLLATALLAAPVYAADGQAVGVDPEAVARLGGSDRVLVVGADISLGEQIVTGASGQVQIVFSDQTRLVVGPGSTLVIESYLFNGNTADKFAINALAGGFRFISGNSAKAAYSITTPTASIAVRGTKFDINVSRSRTDLLLYEGAVRLCADAGGCQEVVSRCDLGVAESDGTRLVRHAEPSHQPLSMTFRYARFQTPLLSPFRVSGAAQCTEDPSTSAIPSSLGSTSGGGSVPIEETDSGDEETIDLGTDVTEPVEPTEPTTDPVDPEPTPDEPTTDEPTTDGDDTPTTDDDTTGSTDTTGGSGTTGGSNTSGGTHTPGGTTTTGGTNTTGTTGPTGFGFIRL